MSRIRTNLITNRMANGAPTVSHGLVVAGVTTVTGSINNLNLTGITTISTLDLNGDLDVDGHLNADNVSIAGVVTATTFSGSGANLTSLPAANLTGTAAAINGSNITNLNASNIASGTVPTARLGTGTASSSTFLRGDSTFATVTTTTINNNADNRVITGGSGTNLYAESGFTFDGTTVQIPDRINCNTNGTYLKENQLSYNPTGTAYIDHYRTGQDIQIRMSTSSSLDTTGPTFKSNGNLAFASGKGIDFSATPNSSGSMTSEVLEYYEEGTWTPTIYRSNNSGVSGNYNHQQGSYVRIGRLVFVIFSVDIASFSGGSGHTVMGGLPFSTHGHGVGGWNYVANMRRMYLDGDYARGVDANSLVAAGGITYMYNMNLDDDQWNYTNYGRILFEGTFTYQTS